MIFNKKAPAVNFLIAGTQKGGTSALDAYLRKHPQIGMAHKKELHFFDDEDVFAGRKLNYKTYEQNFHFTDETLVYGEATPIYMYWKPASKRIYEYNPQIKLIFILRNPVERAFSHWNMEYNRGAERKDFSYCIRHEEERLKKCMPQQHRVYSYADRGFYAHQINRFKESFPDEQMLFIKYEDFKAHQEEVLNRIFGFLEVDPNKYVFNPQTVHQLEKHAELTKADRDYLISKFKEDIKETEKILKRDCTDWLK